MKNTLIILKIIIAIATCVCLTTSCASSNFVTQVTYRSFRNNDPVKHEIKSLKEIPQTATIAITTEINEDYSINVTVYNLTDKTMSIDRTQSFFVIPNGQIAYFDPKVSAETNAVGSGTGVGVNLGAVAGAFGVGGFVGRALSGVNIGASSSESTSTTTYSMDMPVIHIPPKGRASMGRSFSIKELIEGRMSGQFFFGLCIAYSTDRMQTLTNFISQYNMNSSLSAGVRQEGRNYYVNEALRRIYISKPDLFTEKYFRLWFGRKDIEYSRTPIFYDYK